jgi:deoxycytidine triphosphate deaminase
MATVLNDQELRKLLGKVIVDGDVGCIRPNSYILRVGTAGEFLNTRKEFALGKDKKGVVVQPGHSVALTAFETLDFRREAVHQVYPGEDLHGLLSPTTDLSREGIVAPTTQVDAGYYGTLNWTITNTSSEERRFIFKERIYRLTVFRLAKGETPDQVYEGAYQGHTGYVRSLRKGAPVGMREAEWIDSRMEGGPEQLLENLIRSGYPWHALGVRLKAIDGQFKAVADEYAEIRDSLDKLAVDVDSMRQEQGTFAGTLGKLTADVGSIRQKQGALDKLIADVDSIRQQQATFAGTVQDIVRKAIGEHAVSLQNRWLICAASILVAVLGLVLSSISSDRTVQFLKEHGGWIGVLLVIIGMLTLVFVAKKRQP